LPLLRPVCFPRLVATVDEELDGILIEGREDRVGLELQAEQAGRDVR